MFPLANHTGGDVDGIGMITKGLDRGAGGDAPVKGQLHRFRFGGRLGAWKFEIALDDIKGKPLAPPFRLRPRDCHVVGQAQNFDGPRPVRQAADEAPFLEPGDQAVNAGFGFKPQGVLHFVEGGRDAGFAELLVDIHQKFVLFPGQHGLSPDLCGGRNQNPDKAGLVSRPAKNHIIWNKKLTFTLVLV